MSFRFSRSLLNFPEGWLAPSDQGQHTFEIIFIFFSEVIKWTINFEIAFISQQYKKVPGFGNKQIKELKCSVLLNGL